jgi:hypothetical protein
MRSLDHDRSDQQSRVVSRSNCRGGGKDLYNALQCPKEYVLFKASEGAGEHCEAGGREVFFQNMFGWLDPIIAG